MTLSGNITLHKFKERTLQSLETKKEAQRFYPVDKGDLIGVESCAICGSGSISRLTEVYLAYELNFLSTSVCHDCLYTFRSISPSHQWFQKCWALISTKSLEVFNPRMEEIRKERYARYCQVLSLYVMKKTVLDIGAGYGTGSKVFHDNGYDVEALEPEEDKAYYIEKCLNLPVHATSIEEFGSLKANYGLIVFAHTLEHLGDPALIMSRITNLMEPGNGILYLEIPVLWNIVDWSDALYLTHKSNFTEENISYLAAKNGLEVLEKVFFRNTAEEPWDLGLVMRQVGANSTSRYGGSNTGSQGVEAVKKLYRKNLPIAPIPPLENVIKYSVPYIDNFYYTLRLDGQKLVGPLSDSDFISFESVC